MATTRKKPAAATTAATATRSAATATRSVAAAKPATRKAATVSTQTPAPVVAERRAAGAAPAAAAAASAAAAIAPGVAPPSSAPSSAAAAAPAGVERRRSPREKLVAPAVLQPASGDASVDRGVQVQDLSLGGVGFVATEKMDAGEVYRITLGKGPLLLNARVRIITCNKTGHRMYRCGAEFC